MAATRSPQSDSEQVISDDAVDLDSPDHRNSVHQRLRANSSIMQVKKLLGMAPLPLSILLASSLNFLLPVLKLALNFAQLDPFSD
jgi:hypothetical protein